MIDPPLNDDLQGHTIKRYQLEQCLGRGVMGDAYKSIHPDLQQYVVIKVLHPYYGQTPRFRRYFERDVLAAISLVHPSIIPLIDFGVTEEGLYFLVTQYINGLSLVEYQTQLAAPLSPVKAFHLLTPIGAGLHYLHQQGLIHGHLKPGNILIDEQENAFLSDFGLAHIVRVQENPLADVRQAALAYMAPERMFGSSTAPAVDVYALGAVLYRMLTGQRPSPDSHHTHVIPPSQHNPHLPAVLEKVILKAMATEPEDRFADADTMMVAFRHALARAEDHQSQARVRFPSELEAFVSVQVPGYKIQRLLSREVSREGQPTGQHIYQRYLAYDTAHKQQVSLTVLRITAQNHPELAARFQDRLQAMQSVRHSGLAYLTHAGYTKDKRPFAAYEFAAGSTLAQMLPHWTDRTNPLPVLAAFKFIRQVAAALEVAHWAGLLHQELTPENIIVRETDPLPLIIGLEIPVPPMLDMAAANPHDPGYMPPEQYMGEPVTAQSNIYSLGVMLYELLSGHRPNLPVWQVATFDLEDIPKPTPLAKGQAAFTLETHRLMARCLISDTHERFPNLSAFMVQLDRAIAREEVGHETASPAEPSTLPFPAPLPRPGRPHRHMPLPYLVVGGVALMLLLLLAIFWPRSSEPLDDLLSTPTRLAASTAVSPSPSANALAALPVTAVSSPVASPFQPSLATRPVTPLPTPTLTPTSTPTPTETPTPEPATPEPTPLLRATVLLPSTLFAQPDSRAAELGIVTVGDVVTVLGRSESGEWLYVRDDHDVEGFVHGPRLEWPDPVETLPVITAVPPPG